MPPQTANIAYVGSFPKPTIDPRPTFRSTLAYSAIKARTVASSLNGCRTPLTS